MTTPVITKPGVYAGVSIDDYHGREICSGPSISATGLHTIRTRSPYHYWFNSPLNPNRPPREQKKHFSVGKAVHDALLLNDWLGEAYHVLPDGFSRAKTKAMAAEIAEADAAEEMGKTLISQDDVRVIEAIVDVVQRNELVMSAFAGGLNEHSVVAKDPLKDVWLRCRPDSMTKDGAFVLDLKTVADASPEHMTRAVSNFGYVSAAAHYLHTIEVATGKRPGAFWLVVVEKPTFAKIGGRQVMTAPAVLATYEVDPDDIARANAHYVRPAIETFAECVKSGEWPAWPHQTIGLPGWETRRLDKLEELGYVE